MKKMIWLLASICVSHCSLAQSIARDWFGALNIPGGKPLHIVFHVVKTGETYSTIMDSPDQGANGSVTDKTTIVGDQIKIEIARAGITYTGTYINDSIIIKGTFKQGPAELPLTLTAKGAAIRLDKRTPRPQDPKDFPYKQEEVVFTNIKGGDKLAGTLTIPSSGRVDKIVILITGTGPQNRNEELAGHRPFLVWSDWLTRHGIAVLRYDDRGTGQSTGSFQTLTMKGNYTQIHFSENSPLMLKPLQKICDMLDEQIFIRINRQQIVNVNFITQVNEFAMGKLKLTLQTGEVLLVSRRQVQNMKDVFRPRNPSYNK